MLGYSVHYLIVLVCVIKPLSMWIFVFSAAFVGALHSLSPAHWFPIVAFARTRHWKFSELALGVMIAGLGHILISSCLALAAWWVGRDYLESHEQVWEMIFAWILIAVGITYAGLSYRRHSRCHGHTHHGVTPKQAQREKHPYYFLFLLGFSPCVASLPIFGGALARGWSGVVATLTGFAIGIWGILFVASWLMLHGVKKLDHPWLEHHGDIITGAALSLSGVGILLHSLWEHAS